MFCRTLHLHQEPAAEIIWLSFHVQQSTNPHLPPHRSTLRGRCRMPPLCNGAEGKLLGYASNHILLLDRVHLTFPLCCQLLLLLRTARVSRTQTSPLQGYQAQSPLYWDLEPSVSILHQRNSERWKRAAADPGQAAVGVPALAGAWTR